MQQLCNSSDHHRTAGECVASCTASVQLANAQGAAAATSSSSAVARRSTETEFETLLAAFLDLGFTLLPRATEKCGGPGSAATAAAAAEEAIDVEVAHLFVSVADSSAALHAIAAPHLFECVKLQTDDQGFHHVRATVHPRHLLFFGMQVPGISLRNYAERLMRHSGCSREACVGALVLLHRAVFRAGIPFTPRSAHRLFLAALLASTKMADDRYYQMSFYAQVSGVPPAELRAIEFAFMQSLGFALHTTSSEYVTMLFALRCFAEQLPGAPAWGTLVAAVTLPPPPSKAFTGAGGSNNATSAAATKPGEFHSISSSSAGASSSSSSSSSSAVAAASSPSSSTPPALPTAATAAATATAATCGVAGGEEHGSGGSVGGGSVGGGSACGSLSGALSDGGLSVFTPPSPPQPHSAAILLDDHLLAPPEGGGGEEGGAAWEYGFADGGTLFPAPAPPRSSRHRHATTPSLVASRRP